MRTEPITDPSAPALEEATAALLDVLYPDWRADPEMIRTPDRVARAWLEMTEGYQEMDPAEVTLFDTTSHDLIVVDPVPFDSVCAHHMLPFSGHAVLAYVPSGKMVGLSKIPRIIRHYARRLASQENLTHLIADRFEQFVKPAGVMVIMVATHTCLATRGARVPDVKMRSATVRGLFAEKPHLKQEVHALLGLGWE